MMKLLITLLAVLLIWKFLWQEEQVELGPGVYAPDQPLQKKLAGQAGFELNGYKITPLADFRIRAKVLSREAYSLGREAELSPLDLALGWGRMSDEEVLRDIQISQSGRWYRWRTATPPIPMHEIQTHSANMHMIPANMTVEDELDDVKQGQVIELEGFLVKARADDGWRWNSSMTRTDSGARSCELVYVKRVRTLY